MCCERVDPLVGLQVHAADVNTHLMKIEYQVLIPHRHRKWIKMGLPGIFTKVLTSSNESNPL